MRSWSKIFRVLVLLSVSALVVGCAAEDVSDAGQYEPNKPLVPIKRRPIGGTDIQRPRIIEDRNWSIGILPPQNLPKPYSVVVRSVATDEEYRGELRTVDDCIEVPYDKFNREFVVSVESGDESYVEKVEVCL